MTHFRAVLRLKRRLVGQLHDDVDLVLGVGKKWLHRGDFFFAPSPHRDEEARYTIIHKGLCRTLLSQHFQAALPLLLLLLYASA